MEYLNNKNFYKSHPFKCSYIENNIEQRLFIKLEQTKDKNYVFNKLMHNGFRRNFNHMYLPICQNCNSCISSRINVSNFTPSKSQKRNLKKNTGNYFVKSLMRFNYERYELFLKYINSRHSQGQMSQMSYREFKDFLFNSPIDTKVFDLINHKEKLIGSIILDVLDDGLSAVYSFYDPSFLKQGLGINLILKSIIEAKNNKLNYLYLGYWIKSSSKMSYKAKFNNVELYLNGRWQLK